MSNAIFTLPRPDNEPIYTYAPGSAEKAALKAELARQYDTPIDIPVLIGGDEVMTGKTEPVVCPHEHQHVLATSHLGGAAEVEQAIAAALAVKPMWEALPWYDRAAIFLKAAELLATRYRQPVNAATMLGQSKNVYQAEIDAACELIDFYRFNPYYMQEIYRMQHVHNSAGVLNRVEYRALEGFILAVTPFNFTSIGGNLPTAPAIMGNVVLWKPARTAMLSSWTIMQLLREAGLPEGVINFIPGAGAEVVNPALDHPALAGVHFTGSTRVFNLMWQRIAANVGRYRAYPRIVGETGGKDFIVVHPSADPLEVAVAAVRGAFEYQGQKCSAASRLYAPRSLWPAIWREMEAILSTLQMGDVRDFRNFINAVIDESAFDQIMAYIQQARNATDAQILIGGQGDKSVGYFIQPTVILTTDPQFVTMREEIFGPVLTVYLYEDREFAEVLTLCDQTSPYGLTGAIFARERAAVVQAEQALRHSAGNFYINDKPTGAVVGQQPFGGMRGSGTNDKAGFYLNLLRWTSPRTLKENLLPPRRYDYPFMTEA